MKTAIVVEDNLLLTVMYRHYLTNMNYEIIGEVTNGELALEILDEKEVDLIIMDIMLDGEINGIETAIEIRKSMCTPIIFASANSDDFNFSKATSVANSTFLNKPVTELDFVNAVKSISELSDVA